MFSERAATARPCGHAGQAQLSLSGDTGSVASPRAAGAGPGAGPGAGAQAGRDPRADGAGGPLTPSQRHGPIQLDSDCVPVTPWQLPPPASLITITVIVT